MLPIHEFQRKYPEMYKFWRIYDRPLNTDALWLEFAAMWANEWKRRAEASVLSEAKQPTTGGPLCDNCSKPRSEHYQHYFCWPMTADELEKLEEFHPSERRAAPSRAEQQQVPVLTLHQLCNAGLNGFALQLFVESVAVKKDAATFTPFTLSYKGILVTLAPDPNRPIDGRHQ